MPAVLLPCWALIAEPEDLLAAAQAGIVREVILGCIASMVPCCQDSFAVRVLTLSKGWVLDLDVAPAIFKTPWAASFLFADTLVGSCTPPVATLITKPTNNLMAVCHYFVRCGVICFVVPLTRNPGSLGRQRVVLAHLTAAALRTPTAIAPVINPGLPTVQVSIWALITYPPNFPVTLWWNFNRAQVSVGSMVPLLLKSCSKEADCWAFLLYICMLALRATTASAPVFGDCSATVQVTAWALTPYLWDCQVAL